MKQYIHILTFLIATISFMAVPSAYAQTVLIPNPAWPLDSVVNWSVHLYRVQGDPDYILPSDFVWNVSGGILYYDADTTMMAGDGTTATVTGEFGSNITTMYVKWDIGTALDTGYVYLWEISADSCQRNSYDFEKYKGMRIKISAPPKARFLTNETIICSYDDSARIILEIEGMPPYDLVYSKYDGVNLETFNWHITQDDLSDLDNDGEVNNVSFLISELDGITTDTLIYFQLISASSGGVPGEILSDYPAHEVIGHVQPSAPEIFPNNTEITAGLGKTYSFIDVGVNALTWQWELYNETWGLEYQRDYGTPSGITLDMNFIEGTYYWYTTYIDNFGCVSLPDTMKIEIFNKPYIMFSDSTPSIINCSAVSLIPNEIFEFIVKYYGARSYSFTWEVYDYDGNLLEDFSGGLDRQMSRETTISIENRFINYEMEDKEWKVVITSAENEESPDVKVVILDGERIIRIHPKPVVLDDIDFAN